MTLFSVYMRIDTERNGHYFAVKGALHCNHQDQKQLKKRAEKGPAQRLRQRTAILILLILVLGFGAAVLRLTYLTTVQSSELQESAVDLQLADTTVSAKRGTIYDANGNVLAESASVWQVVMSPVNFKNDKQRQAAAKGLSEIFDLEYNDVLDDTKQQSHYVVVKRRIESDEREKVLKLIDTLKRITAVRVLFSCLMITRDITRKTALHLP